MSDHHSDQDMDLGDLSPNETKLLDRSDSMKPVNGEEEQDAWKREAAYIEQRDENEDHFTTTINVRSNAVEDESYSDLDVRRTGANELDHWRRETQEPKEENVENFKTTINMKSTVVDDDGDDYGIRRTITAANDMEHWRRERESLEPKDENLESQEEERIIRLPSENDITEASLVQHSITSNCYQTLSQTSPKSADCLNFTQQERELAYLKHAEIFENWKYSDEERAFLRHRVETFTREQCIIHCILGHMLMTPDEMYGVRQSGLKPGDARQALLSLAIGSHWDVYNLAIIMAFSEKLNVLLRSSGDGLYRNLLEEPRASIESHIKIHVLDDTATPYLLYSN